MKHIKLIIGVIVMLCMSRSAFTQDSSKVESCKRYGVGLSFGLPDFLTLRGSYILPADRNKFLLGLTTGWFKTNKVTFYELGINVNYYFKKAKKGSFLAFEYEKTMLTEIDKGNQALGIKFINYYFLNYLNLYGYTFALHKSNITGEIGLTHIIIDHIMMGKTTINGSSTIEKSHNARNILVVTPNIPLVRISYGFKL
jgi:hypothetical protein